ncbi:hypothetical protein PTSG_10961 [Salpingoeca rosetta]|uniref:Uncharacterized protein n=1 Tax=Salpingoeca rosetta (strain ATCC 50818 / BSB-021) TaxID=946362 RepID=F2USA9_SALR5|nr:uncharacterized protein PTSG_10961 [Salpingoeca rosetta]EGD81018.1 hypothetical protein PTSG_10961 [Salpingoeca rosetta]|eukprot:XP_004987888.1 hypothetical protein PTSG_10961 [Salpingoeca rosetta]
MAKDSYVVNPSPPQSPRRRNVTQRSNGNNTQSNRFNTSTSRASNLSTSSPTSQDDLDHHMVNVLTTRVGIYGWRKYCLYLSVLLLVCLSIINLGMLVFIFRVMDLNEDSAGPLHFQDQRLLVRGRAEFTNGILASNISGFDNSTLLVESNQQIILRSFEPVGNDRSELVMDGVAVDVGARTFDLSFMGDTYFSTSQAETRITSNDVVVHTDTGMRVRGVVQTSTIANSYEDAEGLTLRSVGQELLLTATENVTLESTTNNVNINAFQGVHLEAEQGDIVLSADNLELQNLPTAAGPSNAFALCLCTSGRLFRVDSSITCEDGAATLC